MTGSIAGSFAALEPWSSRFVVDGVVYGGALDYSSDQRVPAFFEWFGAPRTILELSSFEGAHSLQLAAASTTERVLGLEGRTENIQRATLVAGLLGRGNIEFAAEDLEQTELTRYGSFDAVFCAGLLYHLASPWQLLEQIGHVTGCLFLDTHYWTEPDVIEVSGYRGGWYAEGGYADPFSGLRSSSFWLTLSELRRVLTDAGWAIRHELDFPDWPEGQRVWLGCVREPS